RAFSSFRGQGNVAPGRASTAIAPVGASTAGSDHRSLRGRLRGGRSRGGRYSVGDSGCAADVALKIGSRRGLSSASLASDGADLSVVQDGTESFLVAQRKLVAGEVLFGCTPGTLSAVRSRHSIQVAADLHLTVSD
ncbi:unnamed protein product, partial [Laminaria digitata]